VYLREILEIEKAVLKRSYPYWLLKVPMN